MIFETVQIATFSIFHSDAETPSAHAWPEVTWSSQVIWLNYALDCYARKYQKQTETKDYRSVLLQRIGFFSPSIQPDSV